MSGCHYPGEIAVCRHMIPIGNNCEICNPPQGKPFVVPNNLIERLEKLEMYYKEHNKLIDELNNEFNACDKSLLELLLRIDQLQIHKNYQNEENRKQSRIIEELEDKVAILDINIQVNEDRFKKLEEDYELYKCQTSVAIDNLRERIKKLEQYVEMEDRVTASSVLIRLTKLENKVES